MCTYKTGLQFTGSGDVSWPYPVYEQADWVGPDKVEYSVESQRQPVSLASGPIDGVGVQSGRMSE